MMPADDIEIWRPVPRAPEHYEVSNCGRVRRAIFAPHTPTGSTWPGKMRKPVIAHHGYVMIALRIAGKSVTCYAHGLVAEAFLPPKPSPRHTVNHRDCDRSNNHVSNLEWMTPLQQTQHAIANGRLKPIVVKRGEAHHQAKICEEMARVIRNAPPNLFSQAQLGILFGIGTSQVNRIQNGQSWTHLTY